jgi:hypothetical protein
MVFDDPRARFFGNVEIGAKAHADSQVSIEELRSAYDAVIAMGAPILCRSESRRCRLGGVSVFVDQAAEDVGALHSVGL